MRDDKGCASGDPAFLFWLVENASRRDGDPSGRVKKEPIEVWCLVGDFRPDILISLSVQLLRQKIKTLN